MLKKDEEIMDRRKEEFKRMMMEEKGEKEKWEGLKVNMGENIMREEEEIKKKIKGEIIK